MSMETTLRGLLVAAPGVGLPAARICFGAVPQGTAYPYLVLNVISAVQGLTLTAPDGLTVSRVQVDAYALTYDAAFALSRAVMAALHGASSGSLRLIVHEATRESREGGTNEADRPFRASLDFMTHWRET